MKTSVPAYQIKDAKYAKNMKAVHVTEDGTGYKTRADRLASYFSRQRYSNREKCYIMSPAAAAKFEAHFAEGWETDLFCKKLIPPKSP